MGANEIKEQWVFFSDLIASFGAELGATLGPGQLGFFSWQERVL